MNWQRALFQGNDVRSVVVSAEDMLLVRAQTEISSRADLILFLLRGYLDACAATPTVVSACVGNFSRDWLRVYFVHNPASRFTTTVKRPAPAGSSGQIILATTLAEPDNAFFVEFPAPLRKPQLGLIVWHRDVILAGVRRAQYVLVGLVPWFAHIVEPRKEGGLGKIPFASVLWDRPLGQRDSPAAHDTLMRCRLPERAFCIEPGSSARLDVAVGAHALVSLCIRWHLCLRENRSLFASVVAGVATSAAARLEKERRLCLTATSFKYFREHSAAELLFDNARAHESVLRLLRRPELSHFHRGWLLEQLADMLNYYIAAEFIDRSEGAREVFLATAVLPMLRRLLARVSGAAVEVRNDDDGVALSLDFFECDRVGLAPELRELFLAGHDARLKRGRVLVKATAACQLGGKLLTHLWRCVVDDSRRAFPHPIASAFDHQVHGDELPVSGNFYSNSRTGRYDDVAFGSHAHRLLRPGAFPDAELRVARHAPPPAEIENVNLAALYRCTRDQDLAKADRLSLPARRGPPIRVSYDDISGALSQSGALSRSATESGACVSTSDSTGHLVPIEDMGLYLHSNAMTPLCTRVLSAEIAAGRHLHYNGRAAYYRSLLSFEIPGYGHEQIAAHMLSVSPAALRADHERELKGLSKYAQRMLASSAQSYVERQSLTPEDAAARASCQASCSTLADDRHRETGCPYAHLSADALKRLLLQSSPHIRRADARGDERVAKIVELAAQGHRGDACLLEYTLAREAADGSVPALPDERMVIRRPVHYVRAAQMHVTAGAKRNSTGVARLDVSF